MSAKKKPTDELAAAMAAAETFGQQKLTETLANKAPPRPKLHTTAEQALDAGLPIPLLTFESALNRYQNIHTQALHHFYGLAVLAYHGEGVALDKATTVYEAARDALAKYPLTGTNTYAKAMARYREVLLAGSAAEYLNTTFKYTAEAKNLTPLPKRSRLPDVTQEPLPLDVVGQKIAATKAKGKKAKPVAVGTEQPNAMQEALKAKPSILDHAVSDEELKEMSAGLAEGLAKGAPGAMALGVDLASASDMTVVIINPSAADDVTDATLEAIKDGTLVVDDDPNVDAPAPDEFEEPPTLYPTKVAAKTAAIAAMGPEAIEGLDFKVAKVGNKWVVKALAI